MNSIIKQTQSLLTRDGVKLIADIYRPKTTEKLPVLLMRQPYGSAIASTVVYAHPRWYARHGYMVVIQDVRGRGDSEGEFKLFESEINDGYDTLDWVAHLEGSNGKVGMYGFSYQGMTQLYGAISQHRALKTIAPAMIAYDLYSDWAYENGAFCYQLNLAWAIQLSAETARLKGDLSAYKILYLASRNLPILEMPIFVEEALRKYCPSNFYYQWLAHPENDEYWQNLSPKTYFQDIDLPMLHISGWFDTYLRGTLNLYQEMKAKSEFQQCLIVGVWGHLPWGNVVGDRCFSSSANSNIDNIQIAWFDKYLKGIDNNNFPKYDINLFQIGINKWININSFNNKKKIELYLKSTGLANIKDDDGLLISDNRENNNIQEDIIVQDFWRNVPSLGGHSVAPSGSFERAELDNRSDIITYTSEFLTEDLDIIGDIKLEIFAESDKESFDLSAILSQVFSDGKVYNFTQGYIRIINNNPEQLIKFKLQPTCIKLEKNTALRLSLSATNFPAYLVNTGDNKNYGQSYLILDNNPLTLSIFSGKEKPSKLIFRGGKIDSSTVVMIN